MRYLALAGLALVGSSAVSWAATAVASYDFGGNFNAEQSGAPALTPVDPLGTSQFVNATVDGITRPVWAFNGANTPPSSQAGLTLNTSGLLTDPDKYSVDLIFEFSERVGAYRRILDVQNRQSDNGFYVNPSGNLEFYPVSGSTAAWSNDVFHHVVLTVDHSTSPSTVSAYLDGVSQFSTTTDEMNLNYDPTSNPNQLLTFFLDNVAASGLGEWSSGEIAFARLWNGALTPTEAETIVPEPAALCLIGTGLLMRRRRLA